MKPAWDNLTEAYKDHEFIVIGDVDCTRGDGESLCDEVGVRGFPTIMYGEAGELLHYKGGRDFEALDNFTKELKPVCSVSYPNLCSEEHKAEMDRVQKLTKEERAAETAEKSKEVERLKAETQVEIDALLEKIKDAEGIKKVAIQAVKDSGLALLKSVHDAEAKKNGQEEL